MSTVPPHDIARAREAFDSLHGWLERSDFAGYEYDDLLDSPLVRALTFKRQPLRIAAVQIAKRSSLNLRKPLGVRKLRSTKGFAFMIKGYLLHHLSTRDDRHLSLVRAALDWLVEHASPGHSGLCWGNDFDFASRAGFFPKGLPTVVWTSHIQEAFDLAYRVLGNERDKSVTVSAGEFVLRDLENVAGADGECIAYAPGIALPIHNANLLGAAALLRSWRSCRKPEFRERATAAIDWSAARINSDGSWYYGDTPMLHWIDNHHTAYTLDSLCKAADILGEGAVGTDVIGRTFGFWETNFFRMDGAPKFRSGRTYPLDIQAAAQSIESFARYSVREPKALAMAWKVARWTLAAMRKNNGAFRYRIGRIGRNNLEPIHWAEATMLSALGHLLYFSNPEARVV
jgi:hypothetical protein